MATLRARPFSSVGRPQLGISLASRTRNQWPAARPMQSTRLVQSASSSAAFPPEGSIPDDKPTPAASPPEKPLEPEKKGFFAGVKKFFTGEKMDKQRLAELGMGAFCSYGVISNVTYSICLTIAWISFVRVNHVSPLAPGQWKGFLVYYAGLFTFQNIVRPLRFSAAIALAPLFDRAITAIGTKLNISKKAAFGVMILLIGLTTTTCLGSALFLLGGFPPNPPT